MSQHSEQFLTLIKGVGLFYLANPVSPRPTEDRIREINHYYSNQYGYKEADRAALITAIQFLDAPELKELRNNLI